MSRANEPAYPVPYPSINLPPEEMLDVIKRCRGLTLREHFAGLAMQGYLAGRNNGPDSSHKPYVAQACVEYADALIAELAKEPTP